MTTPTTTPASDTERLCRALDLRYKRHSIMDNEAFEAKQHMRKLQAEIDRLESDVQMSEGVAEYHIGENAMLKQAIREALNNQRNCQDILREALEHFTDE